MSETHYRRPDWFTRNVFNRLVAACTRAGISVLGSRVLEVTGRRSGLPRRTPVNLMTLGDSTYLVSPRGESEWVRNVRAGGGRLTLILGRRREEMTATEVADADKPELLRSYLAKWKWEVGMFFEGVGPGSTAAELAAIAPRHPVFQLRPVTPAG